MIKGSIVALVTPFDEENKINFKEIKRLLDYHIENKTDGVLLLGTTAEAESLSDEERYSYVRYVCEYLDHRIPIMVGIISNNTKKAVLFADALKDLSIDSYLVSAPYYVKSNTEGLIRHFTYIADHVNRPIILYNVPKRNGFSLDAEVVKILSYHKNIIGIKEASGDFAYQTKISMFCNSSFVLYAADDLTLLPSLSLGAVGVISVINNAFPKEMKVIVDAYEKDRPLSKLMYEKIFPLTEDIYVEPSPIPIKYLLYIMGFQTRKVRLPLAEPSLSLRRKLEEDYLFLINDD